MPCRARAYNGIRIWTTVLILAAISCTSTSSEPLTPSEGAMQSETTVAADEQPSTTARVCTPRTLGDDTTDLPGDPTLASVSISQAVFSCAHTVIVSTTEPRALVSAMKLATIETAPLLVLTEQEARVVAEEIDRLAPDRIVFVGSNDEVLPVPVGAEIVAPTASVEPPAVLLESMTSGENLNWLVAPGAEKAAIAALPAIVAGGGTVVSTPLPDEDQSADSPGWHTIGDLNPTERWELLRPVMAPPLPGGGTELFPGRRIVAFYGSPVTFRLGLLGEQGPQASVDRIMPLLEQYEIEGGSPVIAGFELIATVADSDPGDDRDYSNELTAAQLAPWIEVATANDVYVIIDLQPGRTDFLTQARRYEEFLRLPNVGLALDPEWRLEPDEEHLLQIGSVDGAEVNLVVEYLAQLVREEQLPQKLLILHQFKESMITNRELIQTPPEVAVVVHVDGQGPLATKYSTFETMLNAPIGAEQTLWWGWKNFIDEDTPTATPSQVNAVDPVPVVVTYQ